jgi:hypothetical protein
MKSHQRQETCSGDKVRIPTTIFDLWSLDPCIPYWASLDLLSLSLLAKTCRGLRPAALRMLKEEHRNYRVRSKEEETFDCNFKITKYIRECKWLLQGRNGTDTVYKVSLVNGGKTRNSYVLHNVAKMGVEVDIVRDGTYISYVRIKELRNRTGCAMWIKSSRKPVEIPVRISWGCLREWLARYVS